KLKLKRNNFSRQFKKKIVCDNLLLQQYKNPLSVPVLIINYNQLFYLKQQIDFLLSRQFENIIIVDNGSNYPPLLSYYASLHKYDNITIEIMNQNNGHLVVFQNKYIQDKYCKGFYIVSDADIVPNEKLPIDFMDTLFNKLIKYAYSINKIGFALKIDDIPD